MRNLGQRDSRKIPKCTRATSGRVSHQFSLTGCRERKLRFPTPYEQSSAKRLYGAVTSFRTSPTTGFCLESATVQLAML